MEQVLLARGDPVRKEMIPPDAELWYYADGEVAFSGGRVSYVSLESEPEAIRHRANGTLEKQGEIQTADESDGTSIGMVSGIADASGERALGLSSARRRQVQAWLGVLGFKPGPPDVDMCFALHVEDQVRITGKRPGAQARKVQLEGVARRSRGRMLPDVGVGPFQCIHEAHGGLLGAFGQVIVEDLLDVADRSLTGNDRLGRHPRSPWRTRLHKESK